MSHESAFGTLPSKDDWFLGQIVVFNAKHNIVGSLHIGDQTDEHSWRPCECCRSVFSGPRHMATYCRGKDQEILEFSVCDDCVFFHANGTLPGRAPRSNVTNVVVTLSQPMAPKR